MLNCIDPKDTLKVQDLQGKSGLSDFSLRSQLRHYTTKHNGRMPQLDELDGANSEPYLRGKEYLNIDRGKSGKVQDLLDKTGTSSFRDAINYLNNTFRDLEITGHQLNKDRYFITVQHRPQVVDTITDFSKITPDYNVNNSELVNSTLQKLADLYGIQIHSITNEQIAQDPELSKIPNLQTVKGFIRNGDIYINESNASIDTKLHEMLHLIFGSVKYQNRELYDNLISMAPQFKGFQAFVNDQTNSFGPATQNDLAEEFMVTELAKYLTGYGVRQTKNGISINKETASQLYDADPDLIYQTMYNMNRLLDSIFMGDFSVKSIPNSSLYNYTFRQVATMVNSAVATNQFKGSLDDAQISRIGANFKSTYMKNNRLREECD